MTTRLKDGAGIFTTYEWEVIAEHIGGRFTIPEGDYDDVMDALQAACVEIQDRRDTLRMGQG